MEKQTAVEWLVEQLKSRFDIDIERLSVTDQAKAMEDYYNELYQSSQDKTDK